MTINIGDVYAIEGTEYLITDIPKRKNQVNYKMATSEGQVFKCHKVVLDIQGEFVRKDMEWLTAYNRGEDTNTSGKVVFKSGDEVVINAPESKQIDSKTAYVVKVNAKTVQIVIPHIGAWNVSPSLLVQKR